MLEETETVVTEDEGWLMVLATVPLYHSFV